jgi:hypothetical protein
MALPDDAPVWATLIRSGQRDASRDRREQAAATRSLAEAIAASTAAGERRHGEMMGALGRVEAAVAKVDEAVDEVRADKPPTLLGTVAGFVRDSPTIKGALANLVVIMLTAAGTYVTFQVAGWASTPMPVEVIPTSPAGAPSSGGVNEEGSPALGAPAAALDASTAHP